MTVLTFEIQERFGHKKHSNPILSLPVLPGPYKLSERLLSTAHPEATPGLLSKLWSSALRYILVLPSPPTGSVGPQDPPVRGWTAEETWVVDKYMIL